MPQPEINILITHLGSTGGGPKFHYHLFKSLLGRTNLQPHYLIATHADNAGIFANTGAPHLTLPTYRTKWQLLLGLATLIPSAIRLRSYIKNHNISVVINSMESIYQGLIVKFAIPAGVKYISCVHDADDHPGDAHPIKRVSRLLERDRADEFVVFSASVAKGLLEKDSARRRPVLETVHGVFETGKPSRSGATVATGSAEPVVIGFLGRLGEYKGLDILVEAVRILRSRGLNVSGSIHGSGPEARMATSEVGSTCHWEVGWIADKDIPKILDSFDILALPYREASQSGVFAYAISRGIPVVATPVGGLVEQVKGASCGLIARSATAVDFADALEVLVRDPGLRLEFGRNAVEASQTKYSWKRVGDDFERWLGR